MSPKNRRLFQVKVESLNVNPKNRWLFQVKVWVYESLSSLKWRFPRSVGPQTLTTKWLARTACPGRNRRVAFQGLGEQCNCNGQTKHAFLGFPNDIYLGFESLKCKSV